MGQYLAIGLVTVVVASKTEMEKGKISQAELIAEMERQLHFAPALFELQETADSLRFLLKQDVLQAQLLPFLEEFYPFVYDEDDEDGSGKALTRLRATEPSTWLEVAEGKYFYSFQEDRYGHGDTLYFKKDFRPKVRISYKHILLSMEGKIIMEEYGRQFHFFKHCMVQAFAKHPLAGALRVYITG